MTTGHIIFKCNVAEADVSVVGALEETPYLLLLGQIHSITMLKTLMAEPLPYVTELVFIVPIYSLI